MDSKFQQTLKRNHYLPSLAILANWMTIAACIWAGEASGHWAVITGAIVIIGARQHALFVMIHEAVHMHISQNKFLNNWISDLFCAFPLLFDTEVYRKNHLAHHRHTNTDQDPDWVRKVGLKEWTFPVTKKDIILFAPYFLLYKGPKEWGYILWRFSGFGEKQRWKTEPGFLLFKAAYFGAAIALFFGLGIEKQALLYWFVPMFFVLPTVGRIRSIAEHFAVSYSNSHNSTRDVRAGWLEGFLLAPFNVHYHLTHHEYPHIPFYHLPKAHAHLRMSGEFDDAHINEGYLWPFSNSVLQDALYGSRPKTSAATTADKKQPAKSA